MKRNPFLCIYQRLSLSLILLVLSFGLGWGQAVRLNIGGGPAITNFDEPILACNNATLSTYVITVDCNACSAPAPSNFNWFYRHPDSSNAAEGIPMGFGIGDEINYTQPANRFSFNLGTYMFGDMMLADILGTHVFQLRRADNSDIIVRIRFNTNPPPNPTATINAEITNSEDENGNKNPFIGGAICPGNPITFTGTSDFVITENDISNGNVKFTIIDLNEDEEVPLSTDNFTINADNNNEVFFDLLPEDLNLEVGFYDIFFSVDDGCSTEISESNPINFFVASVLPSGFFIFDRPTFCPIEPLSQFPDDQIVNFRVPIDEVFRPSIFYDYFIDFGDGSPNELLPASSLKKTCAEIFDTLDYDCSCPPLPSDTSINPAPTTSVFLERLDKRYDKAGTYNVALIIRTNGFACNNFWTQPLRIGNPPEFYPDFNTSSYRRGQALNLALSNDPNFISLIRAWRIDSDPNIPVERGDQSDRTVTLDPGIYVVRYTVSAENIQLGNNNTFICQEAFQTCISIYDTLLANNESNPVDPSMWKRSEDTKAGLVIGPIGAREDTLSPTFSQNNSWQLTESGTVWQTTDMDNVNNNYNPNETSWVESPFIDFSSLDNSFVELEVDYRTITQADGAVLQYTIGDQETWHVLGALSDVGIRRNWYDSQGIASAPGSKPDTANFSFSSTGLIGWSGNSDGWQTMRYPLDEISQEIQKIKDYRDCRCVENSPCDVDLRIPNVTCGDTASFNADHNFVRFRIAFGSAGGSAESQDTLYFAFRNFAIREANRKVLAEHFIGEDQNIISSIENNPEVQNSDGQVINLYYFTDPRNEFNQANPQTHALREVFYLVGKDERSIIDGERNATQSDTLEIEISDRKLDFAPYDIIINGGNAIDSENISIEVIKNPNSNLALDESLLLQTLLVEENVEVAGNLIRIAREFLPNPSGQAIDLTLDSQTFNITLPTGISRLGTNASNFKLVAFIQAAPNTQKEVFQTQLSGDITFDVTKANLITGLSNNPQYNHKIQLFPNPAQDLVQIQILEGVKLPDYWQLFNVTGQMIQEASIQETTSNISIEGLAPGLYWFHIYHQNELLAIKTLMIQP